MKSGAFEVFEECLEPSGVATCPIKHHEGTNTQNCLDCHEEHLAGGKRVSVKKDQSKAHGEVCDEAIEASSRITPGVRHGFCVPVCLSLLESTDCFRSISGVSESAFAD